MTISAGSVTQNGLGRILPVLPAVASAVTYIIFLLLCQLLFPRQHFDYATVTIPSEFETLFAAVSAPWRRYQLKITPIQNSSNEWILRRRLRLFDKANGFQLYPFSIFRLHG
jgi:hypothetical protein